MAEWLREQVRAGRSSCFCMNCALLMEIVKTVEKSAVENKVGRIEKLVLQIGEISSVIPEYMKRCILPLGGGQYVGGCGAGN